MAAAGGFGGRPKWCGKGPGGRNYIAMLSEWRTRACQFAASHF
jgi:hypothetical protein